MGFAQVAFAQFSNTNWAPGAYYDAKGIKYSGLLTWTAPDRNTADDQESVIYFKSGKQSDEIKIPSRVMTSFVINRDNFGNIDSFIVSKNPLFNRKPIIEVLVSRNPVKLYRSISFVMSKAVRWSDGRVSPSSRVLKFDYYFGPDDQQLTLLDDHNFQEIMQVILSDNADAITWIRNKDMEFKDIDTVLHAYKHNGLPPVSAPAPLKNSVH
jgi:hypothetical protein